MKKYWRYVLGSVWVLGGSLGSVLHTFAQGSVEGGLEAHTFSAVDPVNAALAAAVMFIVGIFAYMKRHKKD